MIKNISWVLRGAGLLVFSITIMVQHSEAAQFLVKYRNSAAFQTLSALAMQSQDMDSVASLKVLDNHKVGRLVLVDIPSKHKLATLSTIYSDPNIEYVVPNFKLRSYVMPFNGQQISLQQIKEQWHVAKVNAPKAWELAGNKGSRKVTVAVIDTGVDYNHESLVPNMIAGYDFKENDSDPMDKTGARNPGHGTHCAGIFGSTGLVEGGTVGISPEVSMMPLRFLGEDGSGDLNSAIKAIDYAIEKKVDIISASWGATVERSQATPLIEAIQRVDDSGIIFVAAAANDGRDNDTTDVFPSNAGTPNMITVAASGPSDEKPSWSNYGQATVSLAAPGVDIMSTLPNNSYGNLSGTSMATPLVSGLVAFLKSQDPTLTGAQIRSILQITGARASIETACHCRVDALAAVDFVLKKKMTLVPAAGTLLKDATLQVIPLFGLPPFKFISSNPDIISVSETGLVKAIANGSATVTATDANGQTASSLEYFVGRKVSSPSNPDNPGMPGDGKCPIDDPEFCDIICRMKPELPFCKK